MARLHVPMFLAMAVISTSSTIAHTEVATVYVLEVTVSDRDALRSLAEDGFDIATVRGNTATIYATEREREALDGAFSFVEVGREPDPPKADDGYHTYDDVTGRTPGPGRRLRGHLSPVEPWAIGPAT